MLFCIWNNNPEQTFLFVFSVQLKLANIWEFSNLCYAPKRKDIAKTIAEQEWHFQNKVSKVIKHRKTAMVAQDGPSNLSSENGAKNNTGDTDSQRAV